MSFQGENIDINLHYYHQEFSDWQWVRLEELLKIVIEFKHHVYKLLLEDFSHYLK